MARRHSSDEIAFSSDSFLDIVANMVGILIILIVIAGVRVSRAPVVLPVIENTYDLAALPHPDFSDPPIVQQIIVADPQVVGELTDPEPPVETPFVSTPPPKPAPEPEPIPVFPPLPELHPPADLVMTAKDLGAELERLQAAQSGEEQQFQELQTSQRALVEALQQQRSEVAMLTQQVDSMSQTSQEVTTELRSRQLAVSQAQQRLAQVQSAESPTKELKHQMTPVSKVVTGKEVFFRLAENRVSYLPMMELAELQAQDLQRRRTALLVGQLYQGKVGPAQGYELAYIAQLEERSFAEELGGGRRVGISWMLRPHVTLHTESVDEALRPGSRFMQALADAGPTATVTFWVYPDSFEIHRRLKQYAEETGYWIATRPMPFDVPIAGTPDGSRSRAQ
ncbi:MAG: hypothetical protein KDA58_00045 [Planctomycetaceae bacterium]|nr:hypothetical protein [Planctomycetaceae bacterium]